MSNKNPASSVIGVVALLILGGVIVYGVQALSGAGNPGGGLSTARAGSTENGLGLGSALEKNDPAAVKAAIAAGADVNAVVGSDNPTLNGLQPLNIAAQTGKIETLRALLESKAKTEVRTPDGKTPLMFAAGWGDPQKVKALLDAGARTDARATDGWNALMWAAARGEAASLKLLLDAGADVQASNKWRQTALMHAARTGSLERVNMLLEAGAMAATTDLNGDTAIGIAAANEAPVEVIQSLAKAGGPVDAADNDGVTPLMKAAEAGNVDLVKALLTLGADAKKKDKANGWTAKEWAAKRDDEKGRAVVGVLSGH